MKLIYCLATAVLVLTLSANVRAKGKSRGGIFKSKPKPKPQSGSYPRQPGSDPYPKQPAYNPSYQPNAKPGQTGYGQHGYPQQTGHYPQGGYNNPGQQGYNPNYGGHNYGKSGGLGGLGGGFGKSKGGLGGLGTGLAAGGLGAAVGAYGGYKLGKMVGHMGSHGHYGYYNDRYQYVRCDPPPRIETDPATNITYIPRTVTYDARCEYYDRQPPMRHPYYANSSGTLSPTILVSALMTLITVVLALDLDVRHWTRRPMSWLVVW